MQHIVKRTALNRADFTFEVFEDEKIIFIEDLNLGKRSVTNDMENVLETIGKLPFINEHLAAYKILYRDSDGIIDGVIPIMQDKYSVVDTHFYPIQETSLEIAKTKQRTL